MRAYLIIFLLVLAGCNLNAAAPATTIPAATATDTVRIVQQQTTPVPTTERDLRSIPTAPQPTAAPTMTPAETFYRCEIDARASQVRHTAIANMDYAAKDVMVSQQTRYVNQTGHALDEIVMAVEANSFGTAFVLGTARMGNLDLDYTLEQKRLTLPLPAPLPNGCEVTLDLTYFVAPPAIRAGAIGFKGYFGYSPRQINLSHWLLVIAPRVDGAWVVHPPLTIGEQTLLDQADWEVTVNVENASGDLKLAAPGEVEPLPEGNRWRVRLTAARDLSISLSEHYRVLSATTATGIQVEVFAFGDSLVQRNGILTDGAEHVLRESVAAMQQFESLFGPYPYARMVVVQGDFPDGMEMTGLVYVSTAWFSQWEGGADNFLTVITIHELAHQWWYARVGNDAAMTPWLDEALATYSEYIYYEEYHPQLKSWWWSFRVGWYDPQGDVDSTVYEFDNARAYINAVYLRGTQMLHNLREDMGTEAFFDLLAAYARAADGTIATPDVFWSLVPPQFIPMTQETRAAFLRQPDVFGP